jgi:hypothetical protein
MIIMNKLNFKGQLEEMEDSAKGYYTLGVKTKEAGKINIFWNNKELSDFYELTPGTPATI